MRHGFSAKTQAQAFERAHGKCEGCGGLLMPGRYEIHHIKPRWKGGDDSLENARCLCGPCHLAAEADHDFEGKRQADRKAKVKRGLPVANGVSEIQRRFR